MKKLIKNSPFLSKLVMFLFRLVGYNKFKIKGKNHLQLKGVLNRLFLSVKGNNNVITVNKVVGANDFQCLIIGNNNKITIEEGCILKNLYIQIEDDNNEVIIKENSIIAGKTDIYCCEGSKVIIGKSCMLSSNVYFTTSDRHSILNGSGERVNRPEDIIINNHVWIGYNSTLLKGANVGENCIVGACSLVTKKFDVTNCAIGGNPAKILKENINWDVARLPLGESYNE